MTREPVENVRGHPRVVIPFLTAEQHVQVPITSPGNLQSPLEFWIHTEKTPLLTAPKPLPPSDQLCRSVDPEKENKENAEVTEVKKETVRQIACQVFIPFLVAGFGTVGAGLLLDDVQKWPAFITVPETFVLVPALLGLKGNLEMTLASRVSTQANLGLIDSSKEQWKLAMGNLALLQCQSLVLGFLASLIASAVGWARESELNLHNVLLLSSSSMVTAAAASLLLGSLTIAVVIYSRKLNINPDNVAAPVAASLGDVVTLALLASIVSLQFSVAEHNDHYLWIEGTIVLLGLTVFIPMWAYFAYRCEYTRSVLYSGWIPVISAVAISSGGGYILNFAVASFDGIAACQPVINGVGGNLVAVQACRISTFLHQRSKPGIMPVPDEDDNEQLCVNPFVAWFGRNVHARTARILVLMAIPGHLLFVTCVHYLKGDSTPITMEFILLYLCAALIQLAILLYVAHCLVHWLWRFGFDPDDAAIPYLTALGDLLGTALLYCAFVAMDAI